MPTRQPPRRLNSLPQLNTPKQGELGISIKGNDILKRGCKSGSHYNKPPPPPPSTSPRIQLIDEALLREQQSRESRKESRGPSEQSWRPASVVRRLGDVAVPSVAESTADLLELTRTRNAHRQESAEVSNIKNLFAGIVSGELSGPPPVTRSVACSPLSNWSLMSEDLLEHVSQRVATEQQLPSRSSLKTSRPSTSHSHTPASRDHTPSRDHIMSPHALSVTRPPSRAQTASSIARSVRPRSAVSRPPSGSSSRKRPHSGPVTPVTPGNRASQPSRASLASRGSRPGSARSAKTKEALSYRESLSETGISLPTHAVEKLVSSYDKVSRGSCSRMSDVSLFSNDTQDSSPLYNVIRQKVNAGYLDMVKAFEVYDKGNRGLLSREDFKRVLRHFTVDLTKSQIETLLQRSDLVDAWIMDRVPYKTFLRKYMERGRSGYVKNCSDRPQTGDTEFADIAEARLFAQLHSDFVDVLDNFRSLDKDETGCVPYSDFKNIMSDYGLQIPGPQHEDDVVNYVDYLNSVALLPPETPATKEKTRPQTAPPAMALSHAYTTAEEDPDMQFQQLSLNLQPVHKDPRHKALVKIENCKLLKGGTRRPVNLNITSNTIQGQIFRKFGSDTAPLRRVMQHYDTQRDGHINIGTFRDLLSQFNIKVDENDFYHVINTYDTGFKGVIPYRKFLTKPAY
ncbi:uncharacterized protein LOC134815972 isoform X2 [Bolinopsis microptera]|uniref:uncharacterized protein LOC134815972 isoform X2 n=1 Tax=Bolinopsis microptera TaxID=2820187 RepID=UPI0030796C85